MLAETLLALNSQRTRRRAVQPKTTELTEVLPADQRRLSDVLDDEASGVKPYLALGRIGEGGMGVVHLAEQRSTGREVAIKAVHQEHLQPLYLAAFGQECRITAILEHPNVPPVYDAGADFMVMKRLSGRSLEDRLRADAGSLPASVEALLKVGDALTYAHARGVVHRDLKGDNIMVGDFGEVWVMDWGLAAGFAPLADGTWIAPGITDRQAMCAGTPMCVAPEVATADPELLGPSVDLFMLGALLYRVLSGRYPYEAASSKESLIKAAHRDFIPLLARAPAAPFRLVQAAERAMAWEIADRGTLPVFLADLRTWLHGSGAASEARALLDRATAHLRAESTCQTPAERYRCLASALSDAERAREMAPELRQAHELSRHARATFAQVASAAGDHTLADLVMGGFAPPIAR